MLKFILTIFALTQFAAFAVAEPFQSCCVCVADRSDPNTQKECKRWHRKHACDHRFTFDLGYEEYYGGTECTSVTMYGAFHGLSSMANTPFELAKTAVEELKADALDFDASTCLMFNNTDQVLENANQLSSELPKVKFSITANQNVGVVWLGWHTRELGSATSKMTLDIFDGTVQQTYDQCHRFKRACGYVPPSQDLAAVSDPNEKLCMWNGEVTTQRCCVRDESKMMGRWSRPGQGCS